MVTIERQNPAWEMVVGADGEATRVKSNDRSGRVTITLQQSSPSNDYLSGLAALDELSNTGLVPLYIKDALGTTLVTAATCFVEMVPSAAFGKTANDREWVLITDNLAIFLGGNNVAVAEPGI
jgi:hypothetical protein